MEENEPFGNKLDNSTQQIDNNNSYVHLMKLQQEELEITKKRVLTNEVSIHKELVTEDITITVPITREELVIRKLISPDGSDDADERTEIIRIPLSEERIEVSKQPVILEHVEWYDHSYQEIHHIEESVMRELLHIEKIGNPQIININPEEAITNHTEF